MLAEPARTNYDLHFSLLGVPVRVHPLFWLATCFLGLSEGSDTPPAYVLIWIFATFVSILVHEMGHALAIRRFGWRPRVILWMLGGLAAWDTTEEFGFSYNPHDNDPKAKIAVALAGPLAGFILAIAIVALLWATQHPAVFSLGGTLGFDWQVEGIANPKLNLLVNDMIFINIFWGLVNLLPVFPLDGGQVARELFSMRDPERGLQNSLRLSIATAVVVGIAALLRFDLRQGVFMVLMFGSLAYLSFQLLQQLRGGGYDGFRQDDRPW